MKTKTFMRCFYSGIFFGYQIKDTPVKDRDLQTVSIPKNTFGFRFFDIIESDAKMDNKKVRLSSEPINFSGMYYIGKKMVSVKAIETETKKKAKAFSPEVIKKRKKGVAILKRRKFKKALQMRIEEQGFVVGRKGDHFLIINDQNKRKIVSL